MPLPIIPDVYRIAVNQSHGGLDVVNVIHVHSTGSDSQNSICHIVQEAWEEPDSFQDFQTTDTVYQSCSILKLDGSAATVEIPWESGLDGNGADAGTAVPNNVACVYTLRTLFGGRSRRGRMYIGGIPNTYIDSTETAWVTGNADFDAAADVFTDYVNGHLDDGSFIVASYVHADWKLVTSTVRRSYIGSQRRRAHAP
jgi:hypothetical protein